LTFTQVYVASTFIATALSLGSCSTPDAVSKFSAAAVSVLTSADPIFDDMQLSCLREVNSREEFGTFRPPSPSDLNCTAIGTQVAGAEAAAKILSDYFGAIDSLTSFGTAKAGTDAQNLLSKTSAAFGAGSASQTALGSIAQILVPAAVSGYQQRQFDKDLTKVARNVPAALNQLVVVVEGDYIGRLLLSEEQKLSDRYREFSRTNAAGMSPEVKLTLDGRWRTDEMALQAKRASAQNLVTALKIISKAFAGLAANERLFRSKDTAGLLGPDVTLLEALIPEIHKGF
jgi:hypothetical protein